MDQKLKERLIGIIVLVSLAVIFIPIFLTEPVNLVKEDKNNSSGSENSEFVSKLKPVDEANQELDIKNVEYGVSVEQIPEAAVVEQIPEAAANAIPSKNGALRTNEVGQMNWVVQIGSFSNKKNAEKLNLRAKDAGFRSFINPITQNNKIMHQVCLGPEYDEVDANKLREEIKDKMKLNGIVKKYP